jgi:hypothetical protein
MMRAAASPKAVMACPLCGNHHPCGYAGDYRNDAARLPHGWPDLRIYDNGGQTFDRYTVVFMNEPERRHSTFAALGMSAHPFHPQGFGQHCIAMPGHHLGRRINFADLPADCQKCVRQHCAQSEAS